MTLLSSVLLGLIQGIAEFLPISSSGHLAIAENLLNMSGASEVPEFFDVLLHLGTLMAVFVAYWSDIRDMVVEFFHGARDLVHHSTPVPVPPARRMILLIIVGTLPLFVILPIKDLVMDVYFTAEHRILIVDLNAWGEPTDPLLMRTWDRDWSEPAGIVLMPSPVAICKDEKVAQ